MKDLSREVSQAEFLPVGHYFVDVFTTELPKLPLNPYIYFPIEIEWGYSTYFYSVIPNGSYRAQKARC